MKKTKLCQRGIFNTKLIFFHGSWDVYVYGWLLPFQVFDNNGFYSLFQKGERRIFKEFLFSLMQLWKKKKENFLYTQENFFFAPKRLKESCTEFLVIQKVLFLFVFPEDNFQEFTSSSQQKKWIRPLLFLEVNSVQTREGGNKWEGVSGTVVLSENELHSR